MVAGRMPPGTPVAPRMLQQSVCSKCLDMCPPLAPVLCRLHSSEDVTWDGIARQGQQRGLVQVQVAVVGVQKWQRL